MLEESLYRRCVEQFRIVLALNPDPAVPLLCVENEVASDQFIRELRTTALRDAACVAGGFRTGKSKCHGEQRRVRNHGLRAEGFNHRAQRTFTVRGGFFNGD